MKFIYHISDIHIRNQERHEEYRQVFKNLRNGIKKDTNEKVIVITGDVFHEKTHLSPESIILFKELVVKLNKVATIIIIDGNHDVNINNDKRKSGIFASLKRLNTRGIIHYLNQDNLSVKIDNINFILTEMNSKVLKIENKNEDEIYIALYHGTLYKSKIDNGYEIDNEKNIKASDFEEYDLVMLGDIHKHQYMNKEKTIAYASSLIQQNYGESVDKHGMIKWDIEKKEGEFIEIHNEIAFIKCFLTKEGFKILGDISAKRKLHVEINYESECREMIDEELKKLTEKYEILSYRYNEIKKVKKEDEQEQEKLNKNIIEIYKELMKKHEQEEDKNVMDILEKYVITKTNNREIKLIKMEFENLFSYGKKSTIEFSNMHGIITIIGDNGAGKSSLIDAILFCLYDEFSKGNGREALNISKNSGYCNLWIKVNNVEYKIERKITKTTSTVKLFKGDENISNNNKKNTEKDIVELFGDYNLLNSICISLQDGVNLLNTNDSNKMKMFYNLLNINQYEEIKKEIDFKKNKLSRNMLVVQKEMEKLEMNIKEETNINDNIIINNNEINELELILEKKIKEKNNLEYELEKVNIKDFKYKKYDNFETIINNIDIDLEKLKNKINSHTINDTNVDIDKINKSLEDSIDEKNSYNKKILNIKNNDNISNITEEEIKSKYNNKIFEEELKIEDIEKNIVNKKKDSVKYCDYMDNLIFNNKCHKCSENKIIIDDIKNNEECIDNNELLKKLYKELEISKKNIFQFNLKIEEEIHNIKINKIKIEQNEMNNILKNDIIEKVKTLDEKIKILNVDKSNYILIIENNKIQEKINVKTKEREEIMKMKDEFEEYKIMQDIKDKLDNILISVNKYKEELKKLYTYREELNKSIGEVIMTKKIYEEKNEIVKSIQKEYDTVLKIIDLYNKYEMMNYILNKYIIQLEQIINNILMSIVSYKIKIIQENTELRIYKLENNITINTRQLSGNEKFLINIAFKCALNKMAISYKSDFIIIDEGFGSFDSDKLNKIGELFDVMKREFDKCIIISHLDKIKNMNKTVLMVERGTDGYSKII